MFENHLKKSHLTTLRAKRASITADPTNRGKNRSYAIVVGTLKMRLFELFSNTVTDVL